MRYPLDTFKIISQSDINKLAKLGIRNSDELLLLASTPTLRGNLSQESSIPIEDITIWAGIADLLRIKGIGPAHAELLSVSGVARNVQQFLNALGITHLANHINASERIAEQEVVKNKASDLRKRLKKFVKDNGISARIPSITMLAEAAEEAIELRPRLVLRIPETSQEFRQQVLLKEKERLRQAWKDILRNLKSFAVLGVIFFITIIILRMAYWNHLLRIVPNSDPFSLIHREAYRTATTYALQSIGILFALVILTAFLIFVLNEAIEHFRYTQLVYWLFDKRPYRPFYRKMITMNFKHLYRTTSLTTVSISVLLVIVFFYGITLFVTRPDFSSLTLLESLDTLRLPLILISVSFVVILYLPILEYFVRKVKVDPELDQSSIQRYLIFLLTRVAVILSGTLLVTTVIVPMLIDFHGFIFQTRILPNFQNDMIETRREISALVAAHPQSQQWSENLFGYIDELEKFFITVTQENLQIVEVFIPVILNIVIWMLLMAIALFFVVPYFVLGGWKRGVFYIIVLAMSFSVDALFQARATSWFRLEGRTISPYLVIAFAVFANALFFDWLFDTWTNRKILCPGCHILLDEHVAYCPACGQLQF